MNDEQIKKRDGLFPIPDGGSPIYRAQVLGQRQGFAEACEHKLEWERVYREALESACNAMLVVGIEDRMLLDVLDNSKEPIMPDREKMLIKVTQDAVDYYRDSLPSGIEACEPEYQLMVSLEKALSRYKEGK